MILKCIGSGSKGNAYALIGKQDILLLECGMPLKEVKKAIDYNILKIKGCLLTHEHGDHSKYVRDYLKAGIPVFTNDETKRTIKVSPGDRISSGAEMKQFNMGHFEIIPFYVPHNGTACFAYLIKHPEMGKLLFATDLEYIPWSFKGHAINHFLIECNYDEQFIDTNIPNYEHKIKGHCSLDTCLNIIWANETVALRNVIMCHLSASSDYSGYFIKRMREVAGIGVKVACAKPGLSVELNENIF